MAQHVYFDKKGVEDIMPGQAFGVSYGWQVGTADKSSDKNFWQEKLITQNRFNLVDP